MDLASDFSFQPLPAVQTPVTNPFPEIASLLGPLAGSTRKVRLVHGEPPQAESLRDSLRQAGFPDVEVPRREEVVCLS